MWRFVLIAVAMAYVCPDQTALTNLSVGIGQLAMMTDQMRAHGAPEEMVANFVAARMKEGFEKTKCTVEHQPDREPA